MQPGSLRPLRTVRATFTAYGSGTFKARPAVITSKTIKQSLRAYFDKLCNLSPESGGCGV